MQHNIWSGGRSQPLPMPYARASEREQAITHQINKIQELHSLMQRRNVLWNHRATRELQPTPCGCLARASLHRAQPSTSAIPVSTDRSSPAQQLSQALAPYGKTPIEYPGTDFLRIEYTKSPGNEVNSTYNMAPLHGSVHQINLHRAISGLEATPRLVDIPLPTSEPSRQK